MHNVNSDVSNTAKKLKGDNNYHHNRLKIKVMRSNIPFLIFLRFLLTLWIGCSFQYILYISFCLFCKSRCFETANINILYTNTKQRSQLLHLWPVINVKLTWICMCGHNRQVVIQWLGSRVVSVLDSGAEGPGLKSQQRRCRVTVLGKLFTKQ